MTFVFFSKHFAAFSLDEMVALAHACGVGGYDLCVRRGHPVNPDNVAVALEERVRALRAQGLEVPMVSGDTDLLRADQPAAPRILRSMAECGVPLLKLGYFAFVTGGASYAAQLRQARDALAGWERLAGTYGVRVAYHTHSGPCLGLNGAGLAALLAGRDPARVGAYLDPAHLLLNGEDFGVAAGMVREHLCAVALKDVLPARQERNGHGVTDVRWVPAGQGMVDWTTVAAELRGCGFAGPLSIHCEFDLPPEALRAAAAHEAAAFGRWFHPGATA